MAESFSKSNEHTLAAVVAALGKRPEAPRISGILSDLFCEPTPTPQSSGLLAIADALNFKQKPSGSAGNLTFLSHGVNGCNAAEGRSTGIFGLPVPTNSAPALPMTKRRVFYSFHYDDIFRVNNVRHSEQFRAKVLEVPQSHYDRSLWEKSKRTNPESLKSLIREGVKNTSVVCVLIGTQTFERPWVRYEIARSVIDQKGLLAIDINSINHHRDSRPPILGSNPLAFMGVVYMPDRTYRLIEKNLRFIDGQWRWQWERYSGHMAAVSLPKYLYDAPTGFPQSLDQGSLRYDAVRDDVWKNIASWLNAAAMAVGRK